MYGLTKVWSSSESNESESEADPDQAITSTQQVEPSMKPIHMLFLFLFLWQAAYNISTFAIESLLRFVKYFVFLLGTAFHCDLLVDASVKIPVTRDTMAKLVGLNKRSIVEYVVCPKCHCIYEYNDCVRTVDGKKVSNYCCHIEFPNHPQVSRRVPCGALLLKSRKTKKGTLLAPIKVYPYRPIKNSLVTLLNRPSFLEKCEDWRNRANIVHADYLGDIYDGNVWKKFLALNLTTF